jgi:DNA replication and repair protein RecF
VRVAWIEIRDFRNHTELALQVSPGLTVIVGPNARGKTNLLEAVFYLCALESPRVSADLPLVRKGATSAFLRGEIEGMEGRTLVEVEIRSGGQNRVQVNRSAVRRKRDVRRHARAVFSGPDDLSVVQGDPQERRRFMDQAVTTLWPAKDGLAAAYERVLRQRNRLLKDWGGVGEPAGLSAWDAELAAHGSALTLARRDAVERIRERASQEFLTISGQEGEVLRVAYSPSVEGDPLEDVFRVRLAERRADELIRRTTLVGPHRDELALEIQGLAARGFASHGEAWAAAVSLRLALSEAVRLETGEPPITLLDDPFSALDPDRRRRLSLGLTERGQVMIAVPDENQVPPQAVVWSVEEGGRVVPK